MKIVLLVVFSVIIAIFTALAISASLWPKKTATAEATMPEPWSHYNYFEIVDGKKVPAGSSGEAIAPPIVDTAQGIIPAPAPDTTQADYANKTKRTFTWHYNGKNYSLDVWLENNLSYQKPSNWLSDEDYFSKFLIALPNDHCVDDVAQQLKTMGQGLTSDQFVEFVANFVRYIPYKVTGDPVTQKPGPPKFPYQILTDQLGDCDDKSILAYGLLADNGYDVALIAFPSLPPAPGNISQDTAGHMVLGIGCPKTVSLNNSGFTFLDVTDPNNWPVGRTIPRRAQQPFSIYLPKTGGKIYHFSNRTS